MKEQLSPSPWKLDGGINETGESTICLLDANSQVISDDIYYQRDANLIVSSPLLAEYLDMLVTAHENDNTKEYGYLCEISRKLLDTII